MYRELDVQVRGRGDSVFWLVGEKWFGCCKFKFEMGLELQNKIWGWMLYFGIIIVIRYKKKLTNMDKSYII